MIITYKKLRKHWACRSQLNIFHKEWPQGARITLKNCLRATELKLDLYFVAHHFLTRTAFNKFLITRSQAYKDFSTAVICAIDKNPHRNRSKIRQPLFDIYLRKISQALYTGFKKHPKHKRKK